MTDTIERHSGTSVYRESRDITYNVLPQANLFYRVALPVHTMPGNFRGGVGVWPSTRLPQSYRITFRELAQNTQVFDQEVQYNYRFDSQGRVERVQESDSDFLLNQSALRTTLVVQYR